MSLGGVRDEAEIRGHRRTYIGALPGRLVRALRDAGTMNPVIMLDEVDKVGADWRGDPSAALLEVLDPAQNHSFRDHYLDVELDLSEVVFIATANIADTIPGPLLDRMEVIRFDGYTTDEKVAIARDYLWPRQRERNGLLEDEVSIGDDVLELVVSDYTREAGVRQLERELGKLLRKTATSIAAGKATAPVAIDDAAVRDALGRQRFYHEAAERTAVPGCRDRPRRDRNGRRRPLRRGDGDARRRRPLVLTGQLGDVMKESARIALSWVRAHADELDIPTSAFEGHKFHVHVPAGAIPKDGPSAGITMASALASLLTGRPVKHTVGMTGEITLQGRVLPIGGLKQKVLAAHAAGITRRDHPRAQPGRPRRRAGGRPRADRVPPGDVDRRGARARARACRSRRGVARGLRDRGCAAAPASRSQRTFGAALTCSGGATPWRSCTRRARGHHASTSSGRCWAPSLLGRCPARLDELAGAGVFERRIVNARPPRTEYVLTERGQRLAALLDALEALGSPATASIGVIPLVAPR